jgi:hypothetical protein
MIGKKYKDDKDAIYGPGETFLLGFVVLFLASFVALCIWGVVQIFMVSLFWGVVVVLIIPVIYLLGKLVIWLGMVELVE